MSDTDRPTDNRPPPRPTQPPKPSRSTLWIFVGAVAVLTAVAIVPPAAAGLLAVEPGHRPAGDRHTWAQTAAVVGTGTALTGDEITAEADLSEIPWHLRQEVVDRAAVLADALVGPPQAATRAIAALVRETQPTTEE